ncbi:hypothetical protein BDK51DRAFT_40677 [Blyttiomyces helicus]|uniref:Uncharacterized protein n=1 Tax=Blyttiomyces helicus TaxID=388810 RepID=A0A4P9W2E9_9FUNG|nr:hypothetical protein BDK51DRAFT_40677 [Blyttiomyces helicus]|eukprot:RKO84256.1 hypothetical protein BDK51DRAFT_40677 [Blyttiomyces helicus]
MVWPRASDGTEVGECPSVCLARYLFTIFHFSPAHQQIQELDLFETISEVLVNTVSHDPISGRGSIAHIITLDMIITCTLKDLRENENTGGWKMGGSWRSRNQTPPDRDTLSDAYSSGPGALS